MDKETYIKRLTNYARWRLPREEAEGVIADYQELIDRRLQEEGAEESNLPESLGTPESAVRMLGTSGEYGWWLAVFAFLCGGMLYTFLLLVSWNTDFEQFNYHYLFHYHFPPNYILFYLSLGLIAFWKWKSPKGEGRSPGLMPALLGTAGIMLIPLGLWAIFSYVMEMVLRDKSFVVEDWFAPVTQIVLMAGGCLCISAAVVGLVNSRIRDRRWLSVSVLALTGLFLCTEQRTLMQSLDSIEFGLYYLKTLLLPFGIGAAGFIWTLC